MIIKKASLCPNECFEGHSFFLKKGRFLRFFQLLRGKLSYFGDESPTDCKNAFFLSRGVFSRRLFLFWKKNLTVWYFLSKSELNLLKKLKRWVFDKKYQHGCHNWISRFQRDSLRIFSPEKTQLQKRFRSLSGSSLCFVEKFRQIREKCITASRWVCWGIVRFLWRNNGLQLFFGRWEEKCGTLAKKINNIVRFAFLSVWLIFSKRNFFLARNKHFANCFKISTDFFVKCGTSTFHWQKNSAWLKKLDSMPPLGFATETVSFLVNDRLQKLFSDVGWMFFGLWQKNFNRLSKLYFYLSRQTFSGEKNSPKKTNSFIKFQTSSGVFFQKFWWKKLNFGRKISAQLSKLDSTLPEGRFGEKHVSRKKIN